MIYAKMPKGKVEKACLAAARFFAGQQQAKAAEWQRNVKLWNPFGDPYLGPPPVPQEDHKKSVKLLHEANLAKKSTGDVYVSTDTWVLIEAHYE